MNNSLFRSPATHGLRPRSLIREKAADKPRCRLVCFPYAGGSSAIYRGWQAALGPQVDTVAVELPGHGARFDEAPVGDLDALVETLREPVSALFDLPTVFFGHSNGALIAYALAQRLQRDHGSAPRHLILSAKRPPHFARERPLHSLPRPALMEELVTLAGTPSEVLANAELMDLMLPVLRADFALGETYVPSLQAPLPCPATLIAGSADPEATPAEVGEWARYVDTVARREVIDGGHFFIHHSREALLEIVKEVLSRV